MARIMLQNKSWLDLEHLSSGKAEEITVAQLKCSSHLGFWVPSASGNMTWLTAQNE